MRTHHAIPFISYQCVNNKSNKKIRIFSFFSFFFVNQRQTENRRGSERENALRNEKVPQKKKTKVRFGPIRERRRLQAWPKIGSPRLPRKKSFIHTEIWIPQNATTKEANNNEIEPDLYQFI